jgi:lysine biosynthesis protein LysW
MANKIRKATVALCVECDSRVYFRAQPSLGQRVTCRECGTKLEVVDLDPLELYWSDDFDRGSDDDPYAVYDSDDAFDAFDY